MVIERRFVSIENEELILDGSVILEPTDLASAFVVGPNETFDWNINEGNYCQILFLTSKLKPTARGDAVLWFDHLINLLKDQRHQKDSKTELLCSVRDISHHRISILSFI
jgi:hypothetical protein